MTWEQFQKEYKRRLKTRWGITLTKPMCESSYKSVLSDLNNTLNLNKRMNLFHSFMIEEYGKPTQLITSDDVILSLNL